MAIAYLSKQYGIKGSDAFNAIQLRNLATHTSGLPDEAAGIGAIGDQLFSDEGPSNPLIGYWNNYIGAFVPACWQYSNPAFVTLGFALTAMYPGRTGNQYNQLLRDLITGPLSMKHTSAHPDASLFATGYTRHRDEQKPATEVAADLKSTGTDFLILLKAYLGASSVESSLRKAIDLTMEPQGDFPICGEGNKTMTMGLARQIYNTGRSTLYTKNGSTPSGGFSCDVQLAPGEKFGIAVLTNQVWFEPKPAGIDGPTALARTLRERLVPALVSSLQLIR